MGKKTNTALVSRARGWAQPQEAARLSSLDLLRGFLVSLMILANYYLYFQTVPGFLKHAAPLAGITLVDFGAPLFFFVIGVSFSISLEKRLARDGLRPTIGHFLFRYALIWVFGLLGIFAVNFRNEFGWNVLMAIGLAGLVALPFMFLKPAGRFGVGMLLLLFHQFATLAHWPEAVLEYDMGGYLGAIPWAGLILISSIWRPALDQRETPAHILPALGAVLAFVAFGLGLNSAWQANKPLVSLAFVFLSYSVALSSLILFRLLGTRRWFGMDILGSLGRSALFMYMLSSALGLVLQRAFRPGLAWPLVVLSGLAVYLACCLIALYLRRKNLIVKI